MSTENEEIYRRISTLEKEVFFISETTKQIRDERVIPRLAILEEITRQVKDDVSSIEKLSKEISEEVRSQKGIIRGFLLAITVVFSLVQLWPVIKELIKGAVA
jgi:hypothetical protein